VPHIFAYILEIYVSALLIVAPIILIICLLAELRYVLLKIVGHKSAKNLTK
jgi:hypothetical protein